MYNKLEKELIEMFNKNDFLGAFKSNKKKALRFNNKYNYNLRIVYPGYKTQVGEGKVKAYDYRVDYNGIPVSHVNLVVDLYNKVVQAPQLKDKLELFIKQIAINGMNINLEQYKEIEDYNFAPPSSELLEKVDFLHKKLKKKYLVKGNIEKNYSLGELSILIPLIVLQEDINYPMPIYEGRRMSFYRYLEAIYGVNIEILIKRTLSHNRPKLFDELNYKEIIELDLDNKNLINI